MFGANVVSDLNLATLAKHIPLKTSWGISEFQTGLMNPSADPKVLKRKQLPLLALKANPEVCKEILETLGSLSSAEMAAIDDAQGPHDERVTESVQQILWKPTHIGGTLNTNSLAMNALITWKTILIPLFAVIAPLLAVVIPFFLLPFIHPGLKLTTDDYLLHVRNVLRQQITIPAFLRSKRPDDVIGFFLESIFIALTIGMFMSGIWSQITGALHLRTIWFDLDMRGQAVQRLYRSAVSSLGFLESLPEKARKGCMTLIQDGRAAIEGCAAMADLDGVATFGYVWNTPDPVKILKSWIAQLDCLTAISQLEGVCFPVLLKTGSPRLDLHGVHHPAVFGCISNSCDLTSSKHILLTGPNRGGKSTYCKSVGLAVICAQTWGFAWADKMSWTPFVSFSTALESAGVLGSLSTFEAEIEFAKSVLVPTDGPRFVMMDEIFHSTNATDGLAASQVFLTQLYQTSNTLSIVSTHYKDLADMYKDSATPLCMEATEKEDKTLSYTYKVVAGTSDKSSVMEILKERGLCA